MKPAGNERRDTPGRMLLAWAVLFLALVVLAWRIHLHSDEYDWLEHPTALGDDRFYHTLGPGDDRHGPNLKFTGQEKGLYRRDLEPVNLPDARMKKVALELGGHCFVYRQEGVNPPRYYLKTAQDHYVEFGARKHYPPFVPE